MHDFCAFSAGHGLTMMVDGEINWRGMGRARAAPGFDMAGRERDIYDWVRQVRGGILAGSFTIERHLSAAIIFFLLGDRVLRQDAMQVFDEGILTPMTFDRRIDAALLVAAHLLPEEEVRRLSSELKSLKTLRNAMAHKPFWFEVDLDEEGLVTGMCPFIIRGKGPLALTSAFVEGTNGAILSLIAKTRTLSEIAARKSKAEGAAQPPNEAV